MSLPTMKPNDYGRANANNVIENFARFGDVGGIIICDEEIFIAEGGNHCYHRFDPTFWEMPNQKSLSCVWCRMFFEEYSQVFKQLGIEDRMKSFHGRQ